MAKTHKEMGDEYFYLKVLFSKHGKLPYKWKWPLGGIFLLTIEV